MASTVKELLLDIEHTITEALPVSLHEVTSVKHKDFALGESTGTAWSVYAGPVRREGNNKQHGTHRFASIFVPTPNAKAKKTKLKRSKTLLVIGSRPSDASMRGAFNDAPVVVSARQVFQAMSSAADVSAIIFVNLQANYGDSTQGSDAAEAALALPVNRAIARKIKPVRILPAWGGKALPLSSGALLAALGADVAQKKKWHPTWWETTPESVDSPARPSSAFRPDVGVQPLAEINAVFE